MSQEKLPKQPVKSTDNPSNSKIAAAAVRVKLRRILLGAVIAGIVVVASLMVWQVITESDSRPDAPDSTTAVVEPAKLDMTVTMIEGEVSHLPSESGWQQLKNDSRLTEGDLVRIGADARLILTLGDGSVIRLGDGAAIRIVSLDDDNVRIEQQSGSVYSRVVPSNRQYTVTVNDTDYQALGTAFVTINQPDSSGVQVFQSSVRASAGSQTINQGQQYYHNNANPALANKLTDIDIDALIDNEFVKWNLSQDEKDINFKDKLGVLATLKQQIKQRAEAEAELRRAAAAAAEAAKQVDRQVAAEKTKPDKPEKTKHYQKDRVERGEMRVWRRGNHLGWGYTGRAIHGFQLVYSSRDHTPELGDRDSQAVYVSNQYASSYRHFRHKLDLERHKTYYLTVCAYTDDSEPDACVDYSDVLVIKR